jgi:hypothetical protein
MRNGNTEADTADAPELLGRQLLPIGDLDDVTVVCGAA